jgi:hypothetical protein
MKVYCPLCNSTIENLEINAMKNVYVCPKCNSTFELQDLSNQEDINEIENLITNPPKGILVSKNNENTEIKISTLSLGNILVTFIVLGFFVYFFSKSTLDSLFKSLFLIGSILLLKSQFFSLFGKIVIVINKNENIQDYIFIGIGAIGKKYYLNWSKIISIHEYTFHAYRFVTVKKIYIYEENNLIKISIRFFNENKRLFLLKILKYYWHKNKNYFA